MFATPLVKHHIPGGIKQGHVFPMEILGSRKSPEAEKKRHTQAQTHTERGENLCAGRSTRIRVSIAEQKPYL